MYKIAVMGDRDSIYGFAAIGMDIYPVTEAAQARRQLKALREGGYAIIYVTEALYRHLGAQADQYGAAPLPAVIPIPGITGNTDLGVARVKRFVKQAVGSDILFNDR